MGGTVARLIAVGTVGILYPAGVHGPIHKCQRLYFTDEFLHNPPTMWTVTTATLTTTDACLIYGDLWSYPTKGTSIHYINESLHVTWLLTGQHSVSSRYLVYEGRQIISNA